MTDSRSDVRVMPLERRDPPVLGDVTLTGRLDATDAGIVYAGEVDGRQVAVVLLGEGAETDSYARARFHDSCEEAVAADGDAVVAAESEPDIAPWAAVPADDLEAGLLSARALLAPVTLEHVEPLGGKRGPDFRPHWFRRRGSGRWRMWPLPWPASLTAAGRWTYLVSFALVVAIATTALWIAVKIFDDQPPAPVVPIRPSPSPSDSPTDSPPTPTPPSPTPTQPRTPDTTGPTNPSEAPPPIV